MTTTGEPRTIRASDAVRELTRLYGPNRMTARRFHTLILDGRVPAVRGADGKFIIDRADLPAIAEICDMTVAA